MDKRITRQALAANARSTEYFLIRMNELKELIETKDELLVYRKAARGDIEVRRFKTRVELEYCLGQQNYREAKKPWYAVVK